MATVEETSPETTSAPTAPSRHRSPNYPYFDLPTAIGKTRILFKEIGRHPVGVDVLISKLGYTAKSSSGKKALAALRAYGLVDDSKAGRDQLVQLSGRALDIVADHSEGSTEWKAAVGKAAQSPKLHSILLERYKNVLPPDEELKRYLVRVYDPPFTDAGAVDFIAEIRSTLAFAERHQTSSDTANNGTTPETPDNTVQVGAYVQWTSQGIDRFPEPVKVAQILDGPDGKQYAYVEADYDGALAVEQLTVTSPPEVEKPFQLPPNPFRKARESSFQVDAPKEGMELERKTLDEGAVVLQWPTTLSKDSVDELEHWIQGVLRRARRKAGLPARKKKPTPK
jgi:hypothetical protein